MNRSAARAFVFASVVAGGAAMLSSWGVSWPLLLTAIGAGLALVLLGFMIHRALEWMSGRARERLWRHDEGRYHAIDGVQVHVEDDGRHAWIAAADLQQVLRTREAEDVLAARHSGRWRRDDAGRLWLRVDAVVERLNTMPGRAEPRTIRLRRYLEREVLYPTGRRRERGPGRR
jgi:hypothetical protein